MSDLEKSQQTPIAADVPDMPSEVQNTNQAIVAPQSNDAVQDASQQMPVAADVALEVPKTAVSEPTLIVASVVPQYQVRAGDTLTAIAQNHGISLSELANANRLSNPDQLEINQRIRIPHLESSSATGIGDTVGQEVTKSNENAVLDGQQTTVAAEVISDVPKSAVNEPIRVQIKAGDTLSAIALNYGVSVSELANANHLSDPDLVQINQQLKIPRFEDSSTVGYTSVSVPTLPMNGEVQANAELISYKQAGDSQPESASVPPGSLAWNTICRWGLYWRWW